jgi:hypothetical protein
MRLQIKKLESDDNEIIIDENSAHIPLTLYFNRPVVAADIPEAGMRVDIKIYNSEGDLRGDFPLIITNLNCFTDNNYRCPFHLYHSTNLGGTHIYVHAVLTNTDANARNISYDVSSYHETIKKVYMAADKRINHLYWSGNEQITDMNIDENVIDSAAGNEDAFIHIKAQGMYSDTVTLTITGTGQNDTEATTLRQTTVRLSGNKKVIAVAMSDIIARYNHLCGGNTGGSICLLAEVSFTNDGDLITVRSQSMTVTLDSPAEQPRRRTSTGTVFVNVYNADAENESVTPTEFTDFTIGYMCHLEGVGRTVNRHHNDQTDDTRFTVYPFHVYEIMLSDLVACGLVTTDEAIYLTTSNNALITKDNLENSFDKINARLAANKTLISIFRDAANGNRANGTAIRQILAQVRSKTDLLINTRHSDFREICRDAWQKLSRNRNTGIITRFHGRPDANGYSKNKECPPGEYFVNFLHSTYDVYVSRYPDNRNIDTYAADNQTGRTASPNPVLRSGIAMHNGGARFSTGCLTFNLAYGDDHGNNATFNGLIFPTDDNKNIRRLNFICIDERNTISISDNDTDTYRGRTAITVTNTATDRNITLNPGSVHNFHRFYDLIEPDADLNLDF